MEAMTYHTTIAPYLTGLIKVMQITLAKYFDLAEIFYFLLQTSGST